MKVSYSLLAALCCAASLSSCVKTIEPQSGENIILNIGLGDYSSEPESDLITRSLSDDSAQKHFTMYAQTVTQPLTRTATEQDSYIESFNCSAFAFEEWTGNETPDVFFDKLITVDNHKWDSGIITSSLQGKKMRFYAYTPSDINVKLVTGRTSHGVPVLEVYSPSSPSRQRDVLIAQSADCSSDSSYPMDMTFTHALASVGFRFVDFGLDCKVESIELSNIKSRGTVAIGSDKWNATSPITYLIDTPIDVKANEDIEAPHSCNLYLIPQLLTSESELILNIIAGGNKYRMSCSLSGMELKGNTHTRLTLSASEEFVSIDCTPLKEFEGFGLDLKQSMIVRSYIASSDGQKTPVPWSAAFSTNGGFSFTETPPNWLSMSSLSGKGSVDGETVSISVDYGLTSRGIVNNYPNEEDNSRSAQLRQLDEVGTSFEPIDLSMMDYNGRANQSRNTANCYVIHQPGWYKIPLVYGNAIEEGLVNEKAFSGIFKNAFDEPLTNDMMPYIIKPSQIADYSASLEWSDALNAVEVMPSLICDQECCYAVVYVPKSDIAECNCLVSLRGEKTIWSWHLWVTGRDLTPVPVQSEASQDSGLMPVALGYNGPCEKRGFNMQYNRRSCLVRLKTDINSAPVYVTVTQRASVRSANGTIGYNSAPFYQWGRKDPFAGFMVNNPNNMYSQADCHSNPLVMSQQDEVFSEGGDKYWDSVKTVYDPCPAGWQVPSASILDGYIVKDHRNGLSLGKGEADDCLFFHYTGLRDPLIGKETTGGNCYWYYDVPDSKNALNLFFGKDTDSYEQSQSSRRNLGYNIRPQVDRRVSED